MKTVKISEKQIRKEMAKLSKQKKKELAEANWAGKGTLKPSVVFENRKHKSSRQKNIEHLYRTGQLDE